MNRFWNIITRPILEKANATKVVEIGAEYGVGTKKILEYIVPKKGLLISIDPFPLFDADQWVADNKPYYSILRKFSLQVLADLKDYDAILVDGDHNWYTVYHELQAIEESFKDKDLPIVFLHDISWPYARRDLYYNPQTIPDEFRHPYAKKGMLPNQNKLSDNGGINYNLYNAVEANTPQNGVLTAVEDFIKETSRELVLIKIPIFHGFGILIEKHRTELIDFALELSSKSELLELSEKERIQNLLTINQLIDDKEQLIRTIEKMKDAVLYPKWIINTLSCFIPKKKKRHYFRSKYTK